MSRIGSAKLRFSLLVLLCLWLAFPQPSASQTIQQEVIWGEYFRADTVLKQPILTGTPANRLVDRIMGNLLTTDIVRQSNLPFRWEWFLVNAANTANAATGPGGKFIIYSGLESILGMDESLWAAVLAHEVSHALYRHVAAGLQRQIALRQLLDSLSRTSSKGAAIAIGAGAFGFHILSLKFSRDDESRADQLGLLLMAQAGYDPEFAFDMQERLRRKFGDRSGVATFFFNNHPRWDTRQERTREVYAQAVALYRSTTAAQNANIENFRNIVGREPIESERRLMEAGKPVWAALDLDYQRSFRASPAIENFRNIYGREPLEKERRLMEAGVPPRVAVDVVYQRSFEASQGKVDSSPKVVLRRPESPAKPRVAEGEVFRVGGDVFAPEIVYKTDPEYTNDAREAKCTSTVVLNLTVRRDGTTGDIQVQRDNTQCQKISDTRVTAALALGLREKAIAAVRQWRFRPGMKSGQPVDVAAIIEVTFRLL